MRQPAWAAAPTFAQAWASVSAMRLPALRPHRDRIFRALAEARVISVAPEQVAVLPYLRVVGTGARDYTALADDLAALRLPFDPLYCDLGGVRLPDYPSNERAVVLGGLVARQPDGVVVIPFQQVGRRDAPELAPPLFGLSRDENSPGRLLFRHFGDPRIQRVAEEGGAPLHEAVTDSAERVVAVLRWLESVNVDLVEAPLSPRQREREGKKGRKIALVVHVRLPRSRSLKRGGVAHYSHRFEVRGHYMHFTTGPIFKATPSDKRTFVPGIGECRKVWCPPHVKGPQDKPLIPKVRVAA